MTSWASDYTGFNEPIPCYVDTYKNVDENPDDDRFYHYLMFVGGCDHFEPDRSIDIWWDETAENWDKI